jgi:uncharacterized protein (DUF433 family)
MLYNYKAMRKYIVTNPDVQGGMPVVVGTRVPVEIILYRLKEGYSLPQIHDMYRHVPLETLQKVMEEIANKLPKITNDQAFLQT